MDHVIDGQNRSWPRLLTASSRCRQIMCHMDLTEWAQTWLDCTRRQRQCSGNDNMPVTCHRITQSIKCSEMLSRTQRRFLDGILWHSSNSRHLPVRKAKIWEPNNIFKMYRPYIGWRDYHDCLRWQFAYNDGSQINVVNTNSPHCLWDNWRNQHFQERCLAGTGQEWWLSIQLFQVVARSLLNIVRGYILTLSSISTICEAKRWN